MENETPIGQPAPRQYMRRARNGQGRKFHNIGVPEDLWIELDRRAEAAGVTTSSYTANILRQIIADDQKK